MFTQTQDWIVGYLFAKVEPHIIKQEEKINKDVYVPKFWFPELHNSSRSKLNVLSYEAKTEYASKLMKLLDEFTVRGQKMSYTITIEPYEQYMLCRINGELPPKYKEMTVQQIEEALGYKIKVIGGKV